MKLVHNLEIWYMKSTVTKHLDIQTNFGLALKPKLVGDRLTRHLLRAKSNKLKKLRKSGDWKLENKIENEIYFLK